MKALDTAGAFEGEVAYEPLIGAVVRSLGLAQIAGFLEMRMVLERPAETKEATEDPAYVAQINLVYLLGVCSEPRNQSLLAAAHAFRIALFRLGSTTPDVGARLKQACSRYRGISDAINCSDHHAAGVAAQAHLQNVLWHWLKALRS